MKGKAFAKQTGVFQSIFKATPFETRRGQEFIKRKPFTIILFDKSFINHFGNKSIFEEGIGKDLPKGFIVILVIFEHL